jgi:cytochrome c oxidase assembly protein subunit 15
VVFIAFLLAFTVVILGAYTRLKDAGLGCPDWPGCYGQLTVPTTKAALASANQLYPRQPVETTKAWAEMTHRYFAGILVLLIGLLAIWSFHQRRKRIYPSKIPLFLVGCIFFQAMLGMWTVTWQLLPLVVMGHLLGGMIITTLLWWLLLDTGRLATLPNDNSLNYLKPLVIIGTAIVFLQIFLGGWTSANYASIICPDFPFCYGKLFPTLNFSEAFNFINPIGRNYQGGLLGGTARITIQMAHRYGAFITFSYLFGLGCYVLFSKKTLLLKNTMSFVLIFLSTQVFLGILNIVTQLSLPIAVMHNAVALMLLLSVITILYQLNAPSSLVVSKWENPENLSARSTMLSNNRQSVTQNPYHGESTS